MKTRNWVLLTLAFLIAAIGNASDLPKMNVITVEDHKALITYSSNAANKLEITLSECNGEILYFKRTNENCNEYKKVFDFAELGDGKYCICINYGNRSISRDLNVKDNAIQVGTPQCLFEPYFSVCNNKLNVSFLNAAQKQVQLSIYQNGRYIVGADLGKDLAIQKCIDLSDLRQGKYEVILVDKFKEHRYFAQF